MEGLEGGRGSTHKKANNVGRLDLHSISTKKMDYEPCLSKTSPSNSQWYANSSPSNRKRSKAPVVKKEEGDARF